MTKYEEVLSREREIAAWRAEGATWPRIAEELRAQGILVTDGHLRQYWRRRHGSASAAAVLAGLRITDLQARLADSISETDRLRQDLARSVSERDEAMAKPRADLAAQAVLAADLESCKRQLADVTPRLAAAQRDLLAWRAWADEISAAFRAQDWTTLNSALADLANRFPGPGAS